MPTTNIEGSLNLRTKSGVVPNYKINDIAVIGANFVNAIAGTVTPITISSGSDAPIPLTVAQHDPEGHFDITGSNAFTTPTSGLYLVDVYWQGDDNAGAEGDEGVRRTRLCVRRVPHVAPVRVRRRRVST